MKHFFFSIVFATLFILMSDYSYANTDSLDSMVKAPIRSERINALTFELGWNSLAGIGPNYHYFVNPNVCVDIGLGISGVGLKIGGRGRYLISKKNFTQFLGAGFIYASGTLGGEAELDNKDGTIVHMKLKSSPFLQLVGGIEYIAEGGFMFMANIGYAKLLIEDNVEIISGTPDDTMETIIDIAYRSGITITLNFGYSF